MRTLTLVALAASLLGSSSTAQAQLTAPAAYCWPNGLSCIGMRTSLVSVGSASTLSLWVQSLTGNIVSLGIFDPNHDYTVSVDVSTVGNVGIGTEHYSRDDCSGGCTDVFLDYTGNQGIISCDVPILPWTAYAFRTCAAAGLDGWVNYNFTIFPTFSQPTPTYDSVGFDIGPCVFTGSAHTTNCEQVPYSSVSPEPATLALLVPALLGIGVVRRRRRHE